MQCLGCEWVITPGFPPVIFKFGQAFCTVATADAVVNGRGRNNSKIFGSQQDYLVGKSGSPQIYLAVIWPNLSKITFLFINIPKFCGPSDYCCHRTTAVIIYCSPTKFLVVVGLPDYHYFDPNW